jgi:hypothetical protein
MVTVIMNYLKQQYPDKDIRRYIQGEPYENIMEADITITTIMSSGTALDIPNLRTVIALINISSSPANIQLLGRLRKLPDRSVKYYYVYCNQIRKQVEYHTKKFDLFKDRVIFHRDSRLPFEV